MAAELVRSGALWRAIRWQPAVAGCASAALLLAWRHGSPGPVGLLRSLLLLVVLGVVFLLDDPGARIVEAVPIPWRLRLALRTVLALLTFVVAFAVLWAMLGNDVEIGSGVGLEGLTILAVGLAAAAVAVRYADVPEPGIGAAPLVLGLLAITALLPPRWALVLPPGPQWSAAHVRWALVLVVAAAVVVAAGRDPAARRPRALRWLTPVSKS